MDLISVIYKTNSASQDQILEHLSLCSNDFSPSLNQRVDLHDYSGKIFKKAITFEAWFEDNLIGLLAAYLNKEGLFVYITNVSVLKTFSCKGVASTLLGDCINFAYDYDCRSLVLEVGRKNDAAIKLYQKFGFEVHDASDPDVFFMRKELVKK